MILWYVTVVLLSAEDKKERCFRHKIIANLHISDSSQAQFGNIVLQILKFSLIPSLFPIKKILKIVMLTANIFTVIQIAPTFSSIISILHDLPSLTSSILPYRYNSTSYENDISTPNVKRPTLINAQHSTPNKLNEAWYPQHH